jgi:hypothetical protein
MQMTGSAWQRWDLRCGQKCRSEHVSCRKVQDKHPCTTTRRIEATNKTANKAVTSYYQQHLNSSSLRNAFSTTEKRYICLHYLQSGRYVPWGVSRVLCATSAAPGISAFQSVSSCHPQFINHGQPIHASSRHRGRRYGTREPIVSLVT